MPIGIMVTLRKEKMYEFLERLIAVALPRIRDFKGISASSTDAVIIRWGSLSKSYSRK